VTINDRRAYSVLLKPCPRADLSHRAEILNRNVPVEKKFFIFAISCLALESDWNTILFVQ
jgi:hypothetical protein